MLFSLLIPDAQCIVKCDSAVEVNAMLQNKENYCVEREMQQVEAES